MVRRPPQRRNNRKVHKVEAPPSDLDLQQVARSCRYVGSPYHKDVVSFAGQPKPRPDASICPPELAHNHGRVEAWLRQAVEAGHARGWGKRYPRYA